jgi:acyl-CoA synthetase (AMP-forming)/AMP-acid ligase II
MDQIDAQWLPAESPWPWVNLPDVARQRAATTPQSVAFTFLDYASETPQEYQLSCATLDKRARQIAALLQGRTRPGSRILLFYPAGLEFVCAFFGCLYAGMVAVPAYPMLNPRLRARVATVAHDCDASVAITTAATLVEMGERTAMLEPLARLSWFATDMPLEGLEYAWREELPNSEQLAFLQYTSGSSGTPKGVMVSHGNLLHNVHAIATQMQLGPQDHVFSWLPPYHDMGLIGSLLTPFCTHVPLTFMTPHAFLRRPARWLREITARHCTVSGAPNFAYEQCIAKVTDDELASLELSRWSLAFTGAEPIKIDTLQRFARKFAACGFQSQAFYPCYGMAETTLMVTGKQRNQPFDVLLIDGEKYGSERRAQPIDGDAESANALAIVSCGVPAIGFKVLVVDPVNLTPLREGDVGEIVTAGPSIAHGYWKRELETLATFGVRIPGHDGLFLRTGDLGFLRAGELFVSGRLKDMIIIHGVNHYPQDIETTVDACHEAVRCGAGICFSVEFGDEERLVVVQEIGRRDKARSQEILNAIRSSIFERHQLQAHAIVLVDNGSIHKTTSGKLSRRPCRDDFLKGELQVVARWDRPTLVERVGVAAAC